MFAFASDAIHNLGRLKSSSGKERKRLWDRVLVLGGRVDKPIKQATTVTEDKNIFICCLTLQSSR